MAKRQLWKVQSGQLPAGVSTSIAHAYITEEATTLDLISGYAFPLGSPVGSILPAEDLKPETIRYGTAVEHSPQSTYRRMAWWRAASIDFALHIPLTFVSIPTDTSLLHFSGNISLDLVPNQRQASLRRIKWLLAGLSQENVRGIFIEFINGASFSTNSCTFLEEIQRHLLEPVIDQGQTWSLWTQAEVLGFLNLRLQRFALETGLIRAEAVTTATSGNIPYPTDFMEARRLEFTGSGVTSSLERLDGMAADNAYIDWPNVPAVPVAFVEEPKTALTYQLIPPPTAGGTVDVLYVPLPIAITSNCVPLPFPNFFTNYVKWGVIADMLSKEGEAADPTRASAAEQRWQEGIELAKALLGEVS